MKHTLLAASSALALATGMTHAGNLDRNKTPIDIIFADGNYGELSYSYTFPSISGRDLLGNAISNVGGNFGFVGVGIKYQVTDRFAMALINDQPYGVDIRYGGNPTTTMLGTTTTKLRQSVKLQAQSGVAKDTLVDNAWTYEIGVGRRFTDRLSGRISYTYKHEGGNDLVSPLAPTKGRQSLGVGAEYKLTDALTLSGGVSYIWIGDARPETGTPDTARRTFSGNDTIALGRKIGMAF